MEYWRDRFNEELDLTSLVEIWGNSWPSSDVFRTMASHDYEAAFTEWIQDQKQQAIDRISSSLGENGSLDRLKALSHRLKNGHVLPFVGAGMSYASGYPLWSDFLLSLLADGPQLRAETELLLAAGNYEEAAQTIHDALGRGVLAEEIQSKMGRHRSSAIGPVRLLPLLFKQEVFTTNFDYVLDHAYKDEHPFDGIFCGQELKRARMRLGDQPHSLLRLHGEADVAEGRILTKAEYDESYADIEQMRDVLSGLIGTRSLLFLGCSLNSDRTFQALRALKEQVGENCPKHYAFLPCPPRDERLARRQFLSEAEIHPIYYEPEDHDQAIEDLLITLIEGGPND